ncbi:MTH865 family protein [Methanobacterium paludis]|uniref:MTH865 family protein n=1 Tax=Methanobacterium paludis (strain DSM 25820 / JCM 18151 / SWAN1) TaxID=868131 RepID=UPI00373AE612
MNTQIAGNLRLFPLKNPEELLTAFPQGAETPHKRSVEQPLVKQENYLNPVIFHLKTPQDIDIN